MNTFFTDLSNTMLNGQEMQLNIIKRESGLIITTIPNTEIGGDIVATGTPEDFDKQFMLGFKKIIDEKPRFTIITWDPKQPYKKTVKKDESKPIEEEAMPSVAVVTETKVSSEKEKKESTKDEDTKENSVRTENIKTVYAHAMKIGSENMVAHKFDLAKIEFEKALSLVPEDVKAIEELAKANKWIKMVSEL